MSEDQETAQNPQQDDSSRADQSPGLRSRFGSGYESVTGLSGIIYRHEDRAALHWLLSSVFWFVVVTSFGLIAAAELTMPETFKGIEWLVFSRVRPVHVEGVIYAWLTMMYFGAIFYFIPRLLGTRCLWSETLAIVAAWVYNAAMVAGFVGILTGHTQGREYCEFPWVIDVTILAVWLANIINLMGTLEIRKVRPLYVSVWWVYASTIWIWASVFIENVVWRPGNVWGNPSGNIATGLHDAMLNWWGNHNLFGLWLTPILVAVCYYFVPRITNTPLYSHTLSLLSFWLFIVTYAGVGNHHLLQAPTPGWLKTLAAVNSVGILLAVFAFFMNIYLTMRGNWDRFFTSLPLRFVIVGFLFYILVNVQGAIFAIQPFNRIVHFSYFTIGHSHLALLGGFTILGMGVIYFILPHVLDKPAWSRPLGEYQFWLVTFGFLIYFISMTIAGFVQGQSWLNATGVTLILPKLRIWNMIRAVGGGMVYTAAWIQIYIVIRTYFSDTRAVISTRSEKDSLTVTQEAAAGRG